MARVNAAKRGDAVRRNGYDSYHGRSRVRTFLKVLIVLLLVVLAVAVGALLWLEPYIDYSANGIKINLPVFPAEGAGACYGRPRWW